MTDREEDLRNLTFKGVDVIKRVSYTLTDERKIAKAVALLVDHLHKKNLLTDEEIDEMLLEAAGPRGY